MNNKIKNKQQKELKDKTTAKEKKINERTKEKSILFRLTKRKSINYPWKKILLFDINSYIFFLFFSLIYIICFVASKIVDSTNLTIMAPVLIIWMFSAYMVMIFLMRSLVWPAICFSMYSYYSDSMYYLKEVLKTKDNKNSRNFQMNLKNFGKELWKILFHYFKKNKRYIKTWRVFLDDIYSYYDNIHHLAIITIHRNLDQEKDFFSDFKNYLNNLDKKIILPILDRHIDIITTQSFFKNSASSFKEKYKEKFEESEKILKEYKDRMRVKHIRWRETKSKLIFLIFAIILAAPATRKFLELIINSFLL